MVRGLFSKVLRAYFSDIAGVLRNYVEIAKYVASTRPDLSDIILSEKGLWLTYYLSYYAYQYLHYLAYGRYG